MNEDVKIEGELETPEEESSTPEERTVPYERFKEVNSKLHQTEAEVQSLKTQKRDEGLTPEQEKELQAKTYLKNLLKETITDVEKERSQQETEEQKSFEREIDDSLLINSDVNRADFLKFVENKADKFGITTVTGAMLLYREMNNLSKESADKAKRDVLRKPGLPSSDGGSGTRKYDDSGKTMSQIAEEAKRDL